VGSPERKREGLRQEHEKESGRGKRDAWEFMERQSLGGASGRSGSWGGDKGRMSSTRKEAKNRILSGNPQWREMGW